jgi:hypothetical protein
MVAQVAALALHMAVIVMQMEIRVQVLLGKVITEEQFQLLLGVVQAAAAEQVRLVVPAQVVQVVPAVSVS